MKLLLFILLSGVLSIFSVNASAQNDTEAIKAAIEKETASFFGIDRVGWEAAWLNAPYTFWSSTDSSGGSFIEGTENIRKNFDEYFKTAKPSKSKIQREWIEIRVYGKGAYARFAQKAEDGIDIDVTTEVRVLEKDKDGKWKIVCMNAVAKYPEKGKGK